MFTRLPSLFTKLNLLKQQLNAGRQLSADNLTFVSSPLEAIMNSVPPDSGALSPSDTLNIFRKLKDLAENLPTNTKPFNIVQHVNFAIISEALNVSLPYIKTNDKFTILQAMKSLAIPTDAHMHNFFYQSLFDNVYTMSLNEIILFDSVIGRENNEFAKELHTDLIKRFNLKSSQTPIEFCFFPVLRRTLIFIGMNREHISDKAFDYIEECASKAEIDISSVHEAIEMLIVLSHLGDRCDHFERVLNKALNVWYLSEEVTAEMVIELLTELIKRNTKLNRRLFKDRRLIEKCALIAVTSMNSESCFAIMRLLNQLEFSSRHLINFAANHLKDVERTDQFVNQCITLGIACDVANYKPRIFQETFVPLMTGMTFHKHFDIILNWPKFAVRLHRLGIHNYLLIEAILKQRSHFQKFDSHSIQILEAIQLEQLVDVDVSELLPSLREIVGDEIQLLVHAPNGETIPMLTKLHLPSYSFIPFGDAERYYLNSIQSSDEECLIALTTSSTCDVGLTQKNLYQIVLSPSEWEHLLDHNSREAFFNDILNYLNK